MINKYISLNQSFFQTNYKYCTNESIPEQFIAGISLHSNKKLQLVSYIYLGMGHYGLIISDSFGFYHCLLMGGSNSHERLYNTIAYMLYQFDMPHGRMENLYPSTNIIFYNIEMVDYVSKIYYSLYDDIQNYKNEDSLYQRLKFLLENDEKQCILETSEMDRTEELCRLD